MKSFLRIVVALIFIASGFVKAVDVVGFSFKLEEYFSESVFNLPSIGEYSLIIAVFVVILELILGFMLLINYKLKKTLTFLLLLCVFFAFLTFYSAYYNKVTDCGCFGDAIKFTPWQSFTKDIILLVGLLVIWILYRTKFVADHSKFKKIALGVFFLASLFIITFGIIREPLIDFRNYKIGTDLVQEKKNIAKDPSEYKVFYTLKNKTSGEDKQIDQDEYINNKIYWEEGSPWEILQDKTESKLTKQGYKSEISKFNISDMSGKDITEELLSAPKAVILFSYDPTNVDEDFLMSIETKIKGTPETYTLGVSPEKNIFKFLKQATMDGTAIKTIARSNPFVLILENGKIVDKLPAKVYLDK